MCLCVGEFIVLAFFPRKGVRYLTIFNPTVLSLLFLLLRSSSVPHLIVVLVQVSLAEGRGDLQAVNTCYGRDEAEGTEPHQVEGRVQLFRGGRERLSYESC